MNGGVSGEQDDFGVGQFFLGFLQQSESIEVAHHQVGDDDIEVVTFDPSRTVFAGDFDGAVVADSVQTFGDGLSVRFVVVDDEHADGWPGRFGRVVDTVIVLSRVVHGGVVELSDRTGRVMVNLVPCPGSLSQLIVP